MSYYSKDYDNEMSSPLDHQKIANFIKITRIAVAALSYIECLDEYGANWEDFLKSTDWKEAKITQKQLIEWWDNNQKKIRAEREILTEKYLAKELACRRQEAIAKLSPEDQKLFE